MLSRRMATKVKDITTTTTTTTTAAPIQDTFDLSNIGAWTNTASAGGYWAGMEFTLDKNISLRNIAFFCTSNPNSISLNSVLLKDMTAGGTNIVSTNSGSAFPSKTLYAGRTYNISGQGGTYFMTHRGGNTWPWNITVGGTKITLLSGQFSYSNDASVAPRFILNY
jgi:photosystem II stability/assembly factor-like uncharacterized protein